MPRTIAILASLLTLALLDSCRSYNENIMFQVQEAEARVQSENWKKDSSFTITPFDLIEVRVYNKKGEMLVDPEYQLREGQRNLQNLREYLIYQVNADGELKLPMVGTVPVEGLTLREAEKIVEAEYTRFYDELYVFMTFQNKRVIVLGASGGKVIPLMNENTTLGEVIALAGGIDKNGKAENIRVIRDREVMVADLSTVEGFLEADILMKSGDIVYIEEVRRPFTEAVRENSPVIGFLSGVISLAALIISLN